MALTIALAPPTAVAAPGDLDPTFGTGGFATLASTTPYEETILNVALQPDGKIVAIGYRGTGYVLWRLNPDGTTDTTFGGTGVVNLQQTVCLVLLVGNCFNFRTLALDASGGILVGLAAFSTDGYNVYSVARFTPAGLLDTTFGTKGLAQASSSISDLEPEAMAIGLDGRIVVVGESVPLGCIECPSVAVFQSDGSIDTGFGNAGRSVLYMPGAMRAVAIQDDGKVVVAGVSGSGNFSASGTNSVLVARYGADGQLDASFGGFGLFIDPTTNTGALAVRVLPDGRILTAGYTDNGTSSQFLLLRLNPDATPDPYFGNAGRVVAPVAVGVQEFATTGGAWSMLLQPDGRIVVVGYAEQPLFGTEFFFSRVSVARFTLDGLQDTTFAPGGSTTFWARFGSFGTGSALMPDGRIVVAGNVYQNPPPAPNMVYPSAMAVFRVEGGVAANPSALHQATAVEYYEADWDHYFITATAPEIAALDTFPQFSGWTRAGLSFRVVTEPGFNQSIVCRFFSGTTFAPKSSHFYTPYPDECAAVQQEPEWLYEGGVFFLALPVGTLGTRTCAPGDVPLYRLYNNGQGGAPNHRYTTDLAVYNKMIAAGWVPEGEAQTKLFACLPSQ